ncbi:response regulator transcription factor [Variovorax ginsengisoli]|uniref:Response regulator transcription factor n=1 Tax=Variovorax ginsengisoli TaxID=363844 RepID=A0ABT8S7V0_9BURK|nr:response regulator transcription factor [Variovorax ginsengisoli]MDN8615194.1 response regulator transcription factor [Variovorax ginsengisoli]MDO1534364.1 response regulator transcription factor [Variovorax ginsengisoli]
MSRRVLVIEDDPDIGRLVMLQLAELDCEGRLITDGVAGLAECEAGNYDLLILDLMLPRMDGLQICRRLRTQTRYTPILMLTAKSSELDRVLGLELGADDYLTKPFSMLELAARVKAVFRRADHQQAAQAAQSASEARLIEAGGLRLDLHRHEAMLDGKPVDLTAKEFDLLVYFARSPGRVHTRAQLLDQVWGYSHSGYEHTVNSHINRLRNKIERDPGNPDYIQTVWGVGYKFGEPRP